MTGVQECFNRLARVGNCGGEVANVHPSIAVPQVLPRYERHHAYPHPSLHRIHLGADAPHPPCRHVFTDGLDDSGDHRIELLGNRTACLLACANERRIILPRFEGPTQIEDQGLRYDG